MGTTGKKVSKSVKFGVSIGLDNGKKEEQNQGQGSENPDLIKGPSNDENDVKGVTTFNSPDGALKWFNNPKMSNHEEWKSDLLTDSEEHAIHYYVGSDYDDLNDALYLKKWDMIDGHNKKISTNLYNAINKFELNKAIHTVRRCDFKIFGSNTAMSVEQVVDFLTNHTDGGLIQTNGFLSTTTKPEGTYSHTKGLKINFTIPPNKGGGAYISGIAHNYGESEYLLNNNAVLRFNPKSVKIGDHGYVEVDAEWVGQAKDQAFKKK
ncbi:MAG: hypothetical protein J6Y78_15335 [Paludibacteraceae bacterium]|nr:hypothetical protein [Paludibacteraceae bacterium]